MSGAALESQRHSPSNRSRLRRLLGGGLALAAAAGASYPLIPLSPLSGTQAVAGTPPAEEAMPASVATLEPRETILWDEFSGRLEAVDRVDVRARVGGAVQATHFAEGELVKAGDLLVTIDPA